MMHLLVFQTSNFFGKLFNFSTFNCWPLHSNLKKKNTITISSLPVPLQINHSQHSQIVSSYSSSPEPSLPDTTFSDRSSQCLSRTITPRSFLLNSSFEASFPDPSFPDGSLPESSLPDSSFTVPLRTITQIAPSQFLF